MKTPRGLRALLTLLREHGVTEYSAGGVTIRLGPETRNVTAPVPEQRPKAPEPEAPQDPRWATVNALKAQWKASQE